MSQRDKPTPGPLGDEDIDRGSTRPIHTVRPEPIDPDDLNPTPKEADLDSPNNDVKASAAAPVGAWL